MSLSIAVPVAFPDGAASWPPTSAAAVSLIPIAIIMIHLFVVRRAGALDNL